MFEAVKNIKPKTVQNCFEKSGFTFEINITSHTNDENNYTELWLIFTTQLTSFNVDIHYQNIDDFAESIDDEYQHKIRTEEDIVKSLVDSRKAETEIETISSDDEIDSLKVPTFKEAFDALLLPRCSRR